MWFDQDFSMSIDGKPVTSVQTINVRNPANGAVVGEAPDCTREQLDQAVAAARAAFPAWRAMPASDRDALLRAAAARLVEHQDELMKLLTSEQGKPLKQARGEVQASNLWLNTMADIEIPLLVNEDGAKRRSETRYVPVGVVAGISPWNFPLTLAFWKIAPALKAGNTMVLKPSPFAPLTVLKAGELLRGIFPAGVLNIISGGDDLGPWMTSHPGFDKVSFTGSTATGKRVMESVAGDLKRVTLELGGNDAAIVLPDVDVKSAAKELFWAAFRNSAQICVAAKRIYVHADIYDELAAEMVAYSKTVVVGDGSDPATEIGPLQNRQQFNKVAALIDDARLTGLNFLSGGDVDKNQAGNFIPVTIIDNPPEDSRVVQEEAFGPVLPLLKFTDIDEVIERANASSYGLAGSVWTKDLALAADIASRLETGTVWINESQYMMPNQPFAGHKHSGHGVENGLGGVLEYMIPQTITTRPFPGAT